MQYQDLSLLDKEKSMFKNYDMKWNSLSLKSQEMLLNYWSFVIICANIVTLNLSLSKIAQFDNESEQESRSKGMAMMMYWLAMNKYWVYFPLFSHLPNTVEGSGYVVATGVIGTLPVVIGWAHQLTTNCYMSFRMMTVGRACFTCFYTI